MEVRGSGEREDEPAQSTSLLATAQSSQEGVPHGFSMEVRAKKQRTPSFLFTHPPTLLSQLPLARAELDAGVFEALSAGSRWLERLRNSHGSGAVASLISQARGGVDAARESTFPFLEDGAPVYVSAYSAASLWYAEVAVHEAIAASGAGAASVAHEASMAALRACDLAILRGGVEEWGTLAEPSSP